MHHSEKQSSLMAVEWLEYESSRCPHKPATIRHALNGGEKIVAGYSIDGYLEVQESSGQTVKYGFEYMDRL